MKRKIKYFFYNLARLLGARYILQQLNKSLRSLCSLTHSAQYFIEWKAPPPTQSGLITSLDSITCGKRRESLYLGSEEFLICLL